MERQPCAEREKIELWISAAVDGALSPEEHRELTEHLSRCAACRAAYEETLLLRAAFADLEDPEPPGDLTAAVMAKVRAQRGRSKRRPLYRIAAAAACLALILCGARLLDAGRADLPALRSLPEEEALTEADESDALPGSASEGFPSAAPQVRTAQAPSDEQTLEGAVTYFNTAPAEAKESPDGQPDAAETAPPAVPTLISSDPELLDWMTANVSPSLCTSAEDGGSAWLIDGEAYQLLLTHIAEVSIDYEMDWAGASPAVCASLDGETNGAIETVRVVYTPASPTEQQAP